MKMVEDERGEGWKWWRRTMVTYELVNEMLVVTLFFCTSAPQVLMIQSYQNQPRCMGPEDGRNVWAYIFLGIHIFRYTQYKVMLY